MAKHHFWQGQACRHQEGGPIYGMKPDNVFADDMDASWPKFTPFFGIIWKTNGGDIGGQRIKPDVHDMVLAARNLDPPVKTGA